MCAWHMNINIYHNKSINLEKKNIGDRAHTIGKTFCELLSLSGIIFKMKIVCTNVEHLLPSFAINIHTHSRIKS